MGCDGGANRCSLRPPRDAFDTLDILVTPHTAPEGVKQGDLLTYAGRHYGVLNVRPYVVGRQVIYWELRATLGTLARSLTLSGATAPVSAGSVHTLVGDFDGDDWRRWTFSLEERDVLGDLVWSTADEVITRSQRDDWKPRVTLESATPATRTLRMAAGHPDGGYHASEPVVLVWE